MAVVEALLRAGAYPCFRDNHLISPLHLASTQPGEKETFRRIAELLGAPALLARDEVRDITLVLLHQYPVLLYDTAVFYSVPRWDRERHVGCAVFGSSKQGPKTPYF